MQSLAVVEAHNVVSCIVNCFTVVCVVLLPESLHHGVVAKAQVRPAVALTTHTANQAMLFDKKRYLELLDSKLLLVTNTTAPALDVVLR